MRRVSDDELERELEAATREFADAVRAVDQARSHRNGLVVIARRRGSWRRVGASVGMTAAKVRKAYLATVVDGVG